MIENRVHLVPLYKSYIYIVHCFVRLQHYSHYFVRNTLKSKAFLANKVNIYLEHETNFVQNGGVGLSKLGFKAPRTLDLDRFLFDDSFFDVHFFDQYPVSPFWIRDPLSIRQPENWR